MHLRSTARKAFETVNRISVAVETDSKPDSHRYLLPIDTRASFCPNSAVYVPRVTGTPVNCAEHKQKA
jgi:hypothetical protein